MVKTQGARKKAYPLYTVDRVTGKEGLNPGLTKEIQRALGQNAVEQINETKRLKLEAKQKLEGAKRQEKNI